MSTQEQRRQWRMGVERMRGDLHWDFAYHATDVLLIEVEQLQQELERVRGDYERLLDDATARIGYSEYLRNGGKLLYREWVAIGKPEKKQQA